MIHHTKKFLYKKKNTLCYFTPQTKRDLSHKYQCKTNSVIIVDIYNIFAKYFN